MQNKLFIYNTLSRKKELFQPINPPFVGMYVCGPTVYSDAHLGHARPAITFDLLFRYLKHLGFKVRYVRNITDVGHLVNDADDGEDKIQKKARLDKLEPMEVVQRYVNSFHHNMNQLNTLPPSIEPRASAHIIEQEQMVEQILENGFAYEINGSVYFDIEKYNEKYNYGKLSGRVLDDLLNNTRTLDGQEEKKNPFDFALWKNADPEHIMHWPSKWSEGYPGWHLECSVMSTKYLGETFDIHGGGMDLIFPHHECEIAQSVAASGKEAVKYWVHNNMITINGQKMGKSLGNFITLNDLFSGENKVLGKKFSPMAIRFFILQAHYRSTLDFSSDAIYAAEKGLQKLMAGIDTLNKIKASEKSTVDVKSLEQKCIDALNDDLNSPILISHLFDGIKTINSIEAGKNTVSKDDLVLLKKIFNEFVFDILGLKKEETKTESNDLLDKAVEVILNMRLDAKKRKDFVLSDKIRDELFKIGLVIKDKKDGFEWEIRRD
ncbi:MAG: cysteine--tRNA ligase [Bacteroidetes bacterium]|nr:MAG: cysteine--tRNA ligase [Bacteroidota bacterium]